MSSSNQEEGVGCGPRKKARASMSFKESIMGRRKSLDGGFRNDLFGSDASLESGGVDSFFEDPRLAQLKQNLVEIERFYLKKILAYRLDFESERAMLEKELEDTRTSHLGLLLKLKQAKDRIAELETKNLFYKSKLKKFEEP